MAMLKSSGVAQDAASDMSIKLAGDLASFHNLETDEAFYKLRAGISGESEPLKTLGINMNIVNLEAYAMSQGMHKAYSERPLAEQTILRYNYILAKTKDAQSDFADTAGTWANQTRLLRLKIQSLSAIIGQGLIAALLPAIQMLNKFMAKLTEAAKKLQKQLATLGFDELNQLPAKLDDLTGSLGSSSKDKNKDKDLGLDDIDTGDISDLFDDAFDKVETTLINKWAEAIRKAFLEHDWEGFGKTIAEMLNAGLEKVYKVIKDITPKVESALRAFVKTFNSFVKWFKWDLLGRTIGAGISKAFRGMIAEVEWAELGIALAEGVQGFVDKLNLAQIGKTIASGFNGIIEVIRNFRNTMYQLNVWGELATKIREGLNELFKADLKGMAEQASGIVLDILYMLNDAVEGANFADFGYRIAEALFSIDWLTMFN